MNIDKLCPKVLRVELLRCMNISHDWIKFSRLGNDEYEVDFKVVTWIEQKIANGSDLMGLRAQSQWLYDGPKVLCPTVEQTAALEQVDVNVPLEDYTQPYPAIVIRPPVPIGPFHSALCYHDASFPLLVINLISDEFMNDIVTTVGRRDSIIEKSLQRFDNDVRSIHSVATRILRVAVNSCLALSNHQTRLSYLFPLDVERDRRFAKESTDRGQRAKERLKDAIQIVSFSQETKLHDVSEGSSGLPTGREVTTHWRRGHWAMQVHGPERSLRKRIFRKPVLVRGDLFTGDKSNTSVTYS